MNENPPESAPAFTRRTAQKGKESVIRAIWFCTAIFAVVTIFFILFFLGIDGYPIFEQVGFINFILGDTWNPTGLIPSYGAFPLIVGSLLVTLGAMAIAIPLSIGCAIYIAELAPNRIKMVVKPAIELLAGIPSVVFGFWGLIVLTNWIMIGFDLPTGETWLAGSVLLAIMALPTIISISEDAISSVPRQFKEGSLALGATHWQTIRQVLIPSALSGISAAIILGTGIVIGETMAVMMVTGNAAIIPDPAWNVFSPVRTMTGTLGIEMGEVVYESTHFHALFGVAVVLLIITLIINITAVITLNRLKESESATVSKKRRFRPGGLTDRIKPAIGGLLIVLVLAFLWVALGPPYSFAGLLAVAAIYLVHKRLNVMHRQRVMFSIINLSIVVVLIALAVILFDIIYNGIPAISWEFLTGVPRNLGREGGIFPAIVGTFYLVIGAIAFSLPIGVGAAIYLTEYTREGIITKTIRTGVDLLNGTPSIVFGLFGFAFLVLFLNFGVSMIAGQITLGLMVLPTIVRTSEEALKTVPLSIREGSLALGATRWQTIRRVVLPASIAGILTGTILSIGRASGETAPILFTAVVFSQRYLPTSVWDPVMALPYHLYILATNVPGATKNQYGTALVLLVLVIAVYLVAIIVRDRYRSEMRW